MQFHFKKCLLFLNKGVKQKMWLDPFRLLVLSSFNVRIHSQEISMQKCVCITLIVILIHNLISFV